MGKKKTLRGPSGLRVIVDGDNLYITEKGSPVKLSGTIGKRGWIDYHSADHSSQPDDHERIAHWDLEKMSRAFQSLWSGDFKALEFWEKLDITDPKNADMFVIPTPGAITEFIQATEGDFLFDTETLRRNVADSFLLKDIEYSDHDSGLVVRNNEILGYVMVFEGQLWFQSIERRREYNRTIAKLVGIDPSLVG